ncbi:lipocalin family protein [Salegentibacter mishustinae]|uniref:Lipocalin-like domain-containing protein n=1 Tax=Salegentibacter mishustinae TaxID=270918 RepID=A0A0Q9ZLC5_9FLAO|nr:lipocalin family protein [Salegentibacter mishustinae]KRG29235.1 hypothetical protein APR42_04685 [Salegentibacter mishustinae]PNW21716.1 hypothetical protein APB85_10800 [Salegentibacter mishustinae]PZX65055.1 hypothetical protein LY54_01348 [Salegentibacter mishustinae]GGW87584.1 hypothetical protein GCM10008086_15270 [Salegentibacter mishustinae]
MNKKILFFLFGIVHLGCQKNNPEEQLEHLTGYWEIDRVEIFEDSVINYKINATVDYMEFDSNKGFRKKVKPQFDGSFKTSDNKEEISARIENDSLRLYYKTPFDEWKETVISAEEKKFSVLNRDGKIYYYTKFTSLLDNEDEEEK